MSLGLTWSEKQVDFVQSLGHGAAALIDCQVQTSQFAAYAVPVIA